MTDESAKLPVGGVETPQAPDSDARFIEPETDVVHRIVVFREDDGRYAAEFVTGDGKSAGMSEYASTPVGALAELCALLIKVDEDDAKERSAPSAVLGPSTQERE